VQGRRAQWVGGWGRAMRLPIVIPWPISGWVSRESAPHASSRSQGRAGRSESKCRRKCAASRTPPSHAKLSRFHPLDYARKRCACSTQLRRERVRGRTGRVRLRTRSRSITEGPRAMDEC
jgi:hypothetical protein